MALETFNFSDGSTLEIFQDDDPASPRDDDNVGTILCFHKRHNIGDENPYSKDEFNDWDAFKSQIEADNDVVVILPVYMYDHSYTTYSTTPFRCQWDSGQVGFIFATSESVRQIWGQEFEQVGRDKIVAALNAELDTYQQWANGDIFGYVLKTPQGACDKCGHQEVEEDSCWGFYGSDPLENGMIDHFPKDIADEIRAGVITLSSRRIIP